VASTSVEWEQRVSELWDSLDEHGEDEFLARMEELIAELPENSARAAFERASAFDSTGHADKAVPLYRQALELGLEPPLRRRALIQPAMKIPMISLLALA
jgi:Tetratrico peptide repeat